MDQQRRSPSPFLNSSADSTSPEAPIGILLAAGRGARFDPTGTRNKLLQTLPDGEFVVRAAALTLLKVLPEVLAVIRPGSDELARLLQEAGCKILVCDRAEQGMAATLVHALSQSSASPGWIIALGDMPYVESATITALLAALRGGADIAVPVHEGRRGNPVGFSRHHLPALLNLQGDQGARSLLRNHPVQEIPVSDPGILQDIDVPEDLSSSTEQPVGSETIFSASPIRPR